VEQIGEVSALVEEVSREVSVVETCMVPAALESLVERNSVEIHETQQNGGSEESEADEADRETRDLYQMSYRFELGKIRDRVCSAADPVAATCWCSTRLETVPPNVCKLTQTNRT